MKKLSNFHRKVLNIVVTLMAAIALMLGNVTSVAAYTALDGYPWFGHGLGVSVYGAPGAGFFGYLGNSGEFIQNSITFPVSQKFENVGTLDIHDTEMSFVFPYDPDVYDYIVVGTIAAGVNLGDTNLDFDYISYGASYGEEYYSFQLANLNKVAFGNNIIRGYSFYGYIPTGITEINLYRFNFYDYSASMSIGGDLHLSLSIVPVEKTSSADDANAAILQKLTEINNNLLTNNTLQQQTIDAINQNTTNTSNWFTTLISSLSTWNTNMTDNLRNWFYMIEERMSAGFTTLYHQLTKEQDEKLNGYDDTTQSDAADNFNTESDKLTQLEDQLNDQSHDFVSDYTTTGFNTGVLTTLSSSLIFVTTWFANFWNMGGIFTAGLNLCFSLSIVFFILRLRR